MAGRLIYRVLGVAFAVPVSYAVRRGLRATWRRSRGSEPPAQPGAPGTDWREAVVWAAASAAGITVGELVANRGAARVYRALTGSNPPGPKKK